jgi:hypothetical protein
MLVDRYLSQLAAAGPGQIEYAALSLVGPRNLVDKIVRKLPLLPQGRRKSGGTRRSACSRGIRH